MSITGGLVRSVKDIGDELGNLVILGVGIALLYGGFYAYEWIKSGGLQAQVSAGVQGLIPSTSSSSPAPQVVFTGSQPSTSSTPASTPQVAAITPQTTSTITPPATPTTGIKVAQV